MELLLQGVGATGGSSSWAEVWGGPRSHDLGPWVLGALGPWSFY